MTPSSDRDQVHVKITADTTAATGQIGRAARLAHIPPGPDEWNPAKWACTYCHDYLHLSTDARPADPALYDSSGDTACPARDDGLPHVRDTSNDGASFGDLTFGDDSVVMIGDSTPRPDWATGVRWAATGDRECVPLVDNDYYEDPAAGVWVGDLDLTGFADTCPCDGHRRLAALGGAPVAVEARTGEVDHTACSFTAHDHDWDGDEDPPEQAHAGTVRLCNHRDGAVLFYCQADGNWHHGGHQTPPCFLVSDAPRSGCVFSRHPADGRSGAAWDVPARRVCLTHDAGLSLPADGPCPGWVVAPPAVTWCQTCGQPVDLESGMCACWCHVADALQRYAGFGFDEAADRAAAMWASEADSDRVRAGDYADDHDVTVWPDPFIWPAGTGAEIVAVVRRIMAAIGRDQAAGLVPRVPGSFSALHDHVDANEYLIRYIPFRAAGCTCTRPVALDPRDRPEPVRSGDVPDAPYCHSETCGALAPGGPADAYVAMGNTVSDQVDRLLAAAADALGFPHDTPCPQCGRRQWGLGPGTADPDNPSDAEQETCGACGWQFPGHPAPRRSATAGPARWQFSGPAPRPAARSAFAGLADALIARADEIEAAAQPARWVTEFGADYDVPDAIAALGDRSWHNDACPSFGDLEGDVRVWVEHPDPGQRESGGPRFAVTPAAADGAVTCRTDDPVEAVDAYREAERIAGR